jgi:DNA-binding XRE family transcriptional regulator
VANPREARSVCQELYRLLREERERQGLSKYALAAQTGLSQQTIGYMERGRTAPALETVLRITSGLGMDLAELLRVAGSGGKRPAVMIQSVCNRPKGPCSTLGIVCRLAVTLQARRHVDGQQEVV